MNEVVLHILDRDAARGGRLSDHGILQRFWPDIDPDYQINLMRMRFDLIDDAEWYRHASGARYWGGSINTRDEAIGAEFKARVQLADQWTADVNLRHQSLLELTRSLVRLSVRRTARSGFYTALEGAFSFHKPSSDVGFVAGWQHGNRHVEIALTALDPDLHTMTTEVQVPNSDGTLMPGMYAEPVNFSNAAMALSHFCR